MSIQVPISATPAGATAGAATVAKAGGFRWLVCGLLFFASVINYIDRQVIGILKPTLQQQFGWSELDYGDIVFSFQLAYAIGFIFAGRLMDRLGTRVGFAIAIVLWSVAAMAHAGVMSFGPGASALLAVFGLSYSASVAGFMTARFALGLGEAGNFPGAVKTVAEWFPRKERAFATGIFNAGTNIGALLTPLIVPIITISYGWEWAFIATGGVGLLWLVLWLGIYRLPTQHPRLSAAELAYIQSDLAPAATGMVPIRRLLRVRQAWAFIAAKFFTDAVWRWYLYLLPLFFSQAFKLDIRNFGLPFLVIYVMADLGGIAGGWFSSWLIRRGASINRARKTAMIVCVACVLPVMMTTHVQNMWVAVFLVGLAAGAHQGWSANLFTTVSDMFPNHAVGSVVGFGGTAGALGTMGILALTSRLFDLNAASGGVGAYRTLFLMAGGAYVIAVVIFHLLAPRLEPADVTS